MYSASRPSPPVHIVSDDPQLRAAVAGLLAAHGLAAKAHASAAEFVKESASSPACVLLDLGTPAANGTSVQRELADRRDPVAVVAIGGDVEEAVEAMKLGAVEVLQKPLADARLLDAVRRAVEQLSEAEERRIESSSAASRLRRLSRRELQVLRGLVGGLSNKAMARVLGLSPRTVEMHRANMMAELRLASLPDALRLAISAGLPPLTADGAETGAPSPAPPPSRRRNAPDGGRGFDEQLRLVLEASSDGAWEWDLRTGEIRLSSSLVDRLGYVPDAIPDRLESYERLLHPSDRAQFRSSLDAHLAGESEAYACVYRIRTRDGAWRWTDVRGRVVERDPRTGEPLRMVGTANDITRRREEEERARELSALLDLAQSAVGVGVWTLDVDTRRLHLCARSRDLHGLATDGEVDIERSAARICAQDRRRVLDALERSIADGTGFRTEFRVLGSDGRWRWVEAHAELIVGEGGERRLVGLMQDVTAARDAAPECDRRSA